MIHPDDWSTILRWPRLFSVLESALFATVVTLAIVGVVAGFNFFSRKPLRARHLAATGVGVVLLLSALGGYVTFTSRAWQAACWRLGPQGMPDAERERCSRMPPQGHEGYYETTIFGDNEAL